VFPVSIWGAKPPKAWDGAAETETWKVRDGDSIAHISWKVIKANFLKNAAKKTFRMLPNTSTKVFAVAMLQ